MKLNRLNSEKLRIFIFFIVTVSVFLWGFKYAGPGAALIELKNERLPITPKTFYIAGIIDSRSDNASFGRLISVSTDAAKPAGQINIDLKGGITAVKNFIAYSLPVNKSLHPVIIKIKTLKVLETSLPAGRVNGVIKLSVAFMLQKPDTMIHLVDYDGSANYQRAAGPGQQTEPLLRSTITNSLLYLNNWMDAQAVNNIKLAKEVKVIFDDYTEPEGDTIYYNVQRPLKWTDFQEKRHLNEKYGAEIFAGLGYNEHVEVTKGVIKIKISMKVFVPKSACWARGDVHDSYALNHEQRHFDIARLVAEHFKAAIKAEKLSTDNYDGPINVVYFDALREMDKLQKQYDGETAHSINTYQQQQWDSKIDQELAQLGIKPTNT